MARVPTVTGPDVGLSGPTGAQVSAPQSTLLGGMLSAPKLVDPQVQLDQTTNPQIDENAAQPGLNLALASIPGQQAERIGGNLMSAGGDMDQLAQQIQLQTNAVVTDKAVNDAKEVAMRLQYGDGQNGTQLGFTQLKGWDAVNRPAQPDGQKLALPDEYTAKYNDQVQSIRDGLSNDQQRKAFDIQSSDIQTSLYGAATQHQSQELNAYNLSVQDGTIATEKNSIGLNYTDPLAMNASIARIKGAVAAQGMLTSKSAQWVNAQGQLQVADALEGAFKQIASTKNTGQMAGFLNTYASQMTPTTLAAARTMINTTMDTSLGVNAGVQAVQTVAPKMGLPQDYTRLLNLVANQESGNRDFKPDGTVVTSSMGAQGRMQVMPATAKAMGLPPLSAHPSQAEMDQLARGGQALLGQLVQRYAGDTGKAVAAYNSNPKTVDAAVKAAALDGSSWLSHTPAETQAYTTAIMTKMNAGAGVPAPPAWGDVEQSILKTVDPRTGAPISGEVLKQALTTGHEQFDYLVKDQNQQREALKAKVTQQVATGTPYDQVAPADKAALGMDAPALIEFSQKVQEGKLIPTNPDVQLKMMDDTYLRSMTDQQFMNTKTQLAGAVWDSFAAHRRSLLSGGGQGPGDLNTPAIKTTVDGLLNQMGINPYPKAAGFGADPQAVSRVAAVHQYVRDAVVTAQQQAGKKFNDADTEAAVNKIFSRDVHFKTTLFGGTIDHGSQRMLGMSASDIPSDVADNLRANFNKIGVAKPTDGQLLGAYWHGNPR